MHYLSDLSPLFILPHRALASVKLSVAPFQILSKPPGLLLLPFPPRWQALYSVAPQQRFYFIPSHKNDRQRAPTGCAQEHIPQQPRPQTSLPAMTHSPTEVHSPSLLSCPLLARVSVMTEPGRENCLAGMSEETDVIGKGRKPDGQVQRMFYLHC